MSITPTGGISMKNGTEIGGGSADLTGKGIRYDSVPTKHQPRCAAVLENAERLVENARALAEMADDVESRLLGPHPEMEEGNSTVSAPPTGFVAKLEGALARLERQMDAAAHSLELVDQELG